MLYNNTIQYYTFKNYMEIYLLTTKDVQDILLSKKKERDYKILYGTTSFKK